MVFRDQAHLQGVDWGKLALALAIAASLVALELVGRWLAGY